MTREMAGDGQWRKGRTISNTWRIEDVLSNEGGFGVVYRGLHLRTRAAVAIKFLRENLTDEENQIRFIREAQIIAALDHPAVVRVLDVGSDDELGSYQVLELLRGETLDGRLSRLPDERLGVEECARILLPVMSALELAHDRGVVHRDVKPSNIMIHRDDRGVEGARILDFGIAKNLNASKTFATTVGKFIGSPQYMSPEQLRGTTDARTDVWALGVVWYECLAGRRPFEGEDLLAVADNIRQSTPPPLGDLGTAVSAELGAAIMRALEKDPDRRIASMAEFRRLVTDAVGGAESMVAVRPRSTPAPPSTIAGAERQPFSWRRPLLGPLSGALAGALFVLVYQTRCASPPTLVLPPTGALYGDAGGASTSVERAPMSTGPQASLDAGRAEDSSLDAGSVRMPTVRPHVQPRSRRAFNPLDVSF